MNQPSFRTAARVAQLSLVAFVAACSSQPQPQLEPETPVRIAPLAGAVQPGDCPEALRRAAAKSDVEVDRLASPRTNVGTALRDRSMPTAVRRARYNEVSVSVLIDTLGKADMRTFRVVKTTHPWLADRLKVAVKKETFDPAQLAGCRVPRVWLGKFTSGTPPPPRPDRKGVRNGYGLLNSQYRDAEGRTARQRRASRHAKVE